MKFSVTLFLATLIFLVLMSAINKTQVPEIDNRMRGTKTVAHVAVIVKDIEKTTKACAELLGIETPKWEMVTNPVYMGKKMEGKAKTAFIDLENISFEIFEPVERARQELPDEYREGMPHFRIWIEGLDENVNHHPEKDCRVVQNESSLWGEKNYIDVMPEVRIMFELMGKTAVN